MQTYVWCGRNVLLGFHLEGIVLLMLFFSCFRAELSMKCDADISYDDNQVSIITTPITSPERRFILFGCFVLFSSSFSYFFLLYYRLAELRVLKTSLKAIRMTSVLRSPMVLKVEMPVERRIIGTLGMKMRRDNLEELKVRFGRKV